LFTIYHPVSTIVGILILLQVDMIPKEILHQLRLLKIIVFLLMWKVDLFNLILVMSFEPVKISVIVQQ